MLGGRNQRAFAVTEYSRKIGGGYGFSECGNFAVSLIKAGADKNKTRIDRCRSERQADG